MQIRFKKLKDAGNVQFAAGQLVDLPPELAKTFLDEKVAIEVPAAERATAPRVPEGAIIPRRTEKTKKGR